MLVEEFVFLVLTPLQPDPVDTRKMAMCQVDLSADAQSRGTGVDPAGSLFADVAADQRILDQRMKLGMGYLGVDRF